MDVDTFSSCQGLFALFNSVFNTVMFNCLFPRWILTLPSSWRTAQELLFNTKPLSPFSGHADGVSTTAGHSLCRRCCQSVFINCLAEVLSNWPPFPQMIESFCLATHLDFLLMAFAALLGGVRVGEHSNVLRSCQQEWISWDSDTSIILSSSRRAS